MLRFEKSFNGFETVGNAYAFLDLCCKACAVELAHTQAEIEAMPNGTENASLTGYIRMPTSPYSSFKVNDTFHNPL